MKEIPKRGDNNFEAMRPNKTKIPMPTKRDYEINKFHTALAMIKDFRYQLWMSNADVIGPNRKRIDSDGEVYMSKFRRGGRL